MSPSGVLFVVATPLGNLEDITFRAVRVLGEVALVAAEDTRRTRKLLDHYGLKPRVISYREQNHAKVLPRLLTALQDGLDVALVTDAGTPGVSDPGALLVQEAARLGALVTPAPGPSAVACALSVAGLPADSFVFAGFLPARKKARLDFLTGLRLEPRTLVFFEAPHRLKDSLADMREVLGHREAVMCREMTKLNEEFLRGTLTDLSEEVTRRTKQIRGEATIIVAGSSSPEGQGLTKEELVEIIQGDERPTREIVADLSKTSGLSRSELYRLVLEVANRMK